jgi:hypothetical protein
MTTPNSPPKRPFVDRCLAGCRAWLLTNTRAGREFSYKQSLIDTAATYFADVDRTHVCGPWANARLTGLTNL